MNDPPRGLVFRDGTRWRTEAELARAVVADLEAAREARGEARTPALLQALLSAGALECALADDPERDEAEVAIAAALTDRVAEALACSTAAPPVPALAWR